MPLAEWLAGSSGGKQERLSFIAQVLASGSRFAFYPVSASAQNRTRHHNRVALPSAESPHNVHSFSTMKSWPDAYKAFAGLWGLSIDHDEMGLFLLTDGIKLSLGWGI